MSKKKRKKKRTRTREHKNIKTTKQKPEEPTVEVDVRSDLRKTAILTTFCLGILFVLYLTRSRFLP